MQTVRAPVVLMMILLCLPMAALAEIEQSRFALRALGVKVGELTLSSDVGVSRYAVRSRLETTGLASAISRVRFEIAAQGRRRGARFMPQRYVEEEVAGQRETRVRLEYAQGLARASGAEISDRGDHAVTDVQQRGAVDPLTAIFLVLRDQPPEGVCRLRQKIFDGERLTEITLTQRSDRNGTVQCSGFFTRVAGYRPGDLRQGSRFALTVTYAPMGPVMRAMRVDADTVFGAATVVRK